MLDQKTLPHCESTQISGLQTHRHDELLVVAFKRKCYTFLGQPIIIHGFFISYISTAYVARINTNVVYGKLFRTAVQKMADTLLYV
jgi:hypothetical protein